MRLGAVVKTKSEQDNPAFTIRDVKNGWFAADYFITLNIPAQQQRFIPIIMEKVRKIIALMVPMDRRKYVTRYLIIV